MRITVTIGDEVHKALKEQARAEGKTLSAIISEFVIRGLAEKRAARPVKWHSQDMGDLLVDIEDKDALRAVLDEHYTKHFWWPSQRLGAKFDLVDKEAVWAVLDREQFGDLFDFDED